MNLGTDVYLIDDYKQSAVGDLQTISQISNVKQALYRRIITNPGALPHRPKYGVGIYKYINKPATMSNRQELANAIKRNILFDKRVKEVKKVLCDWIDNIAHVYISVNIYGNYVEFEFEVIKL